MSRTGWVVIVLALGLAGCGSLGKKNIDVQFVSTKSLDSQDLMSQQWVFKSSEPVSVKMTVGGKDVVLVPTVSAGSVQYTFTISLAPAAKSAQGQVNIVAEQVGSSAEKKTVTADVTIPNINASSVRSAIKTLKPTGGGPVPQTFGVLKVGSDQATGTISFQQDLNLNQLRHEAR